MCIVRDSTKVRSAIAKQAGGGGPLAKLLSSNAQKVAYYPPMEVYHKSYVFANFVGKIRRALVLEKKVVLHQLKVGSRARHGGFLTAYSIIHRPRGRGTDDLYNTSPPVELYHRNCVLANFLLLADELNQG